MRVVEPTAPVAGIPRRLLFILPVEPGVTNVASEFGDGLDELRQMDVANRYNLTLIEPSFSITPWYVDQVDRSKALLYRALDRVGLRYWRSAANFVLVDGGPSVAALVAGMIAGGVLVRDRSHDPYCPNCFRITAGLVEHTTTAVGVLETLCAKR